MPPFEQKVFDRFDLPKNRTSASFRFKILFLWDKQVVEEFFTDSAVERIRLVNEGTACAYEVKVEERTMQINIPVTANLGAEPTLEDLRELVEKTKQIPGGAAIRFEIVRGQRDSETVTVIIQGAALLGD